MSTRIQNMGRFLNKNAPVTFTFNGRSLGGYLGDTLASALLANDRMLMGRSFKYHRPRGAIASGAEEPNALVNMGQGVFSDSVIHHKHLAMVCYATKNECSILHIQWIGCCSPGAWAAVKIV